MLDEGFASSAIRTEIDMPRTPRPAAPAGLRSPPPLRPVAPRLAAETDVERLRGAALPPTVAQWTWGLSIAATLIAGLLVAPAATLTGLHHLLYVAFTLAAGSRLAAAALAGPPPPVPRLADAALPPYTVLAPLYGEAAIAPDLVAALSALNYPRDRLQILILLEADDAPTRAALAALTLPPFIQLLVAPPGHPRTKPRACNIGLDQASGELLTIYDAEDRPHPGQLREAAARFAAGSPRLACLQAPLRIDPDRRWLPSQFALEYALQFEVLLPALARLGLPFPLGGTSNHFRVPALRAVGGWDAWNVTEDADLGFRLAAEGFSSGVLASPTHEPAPTRLYDWLPQRARWIKGYMQTFGVQSRQPPHWRTGAAAAFALTLGAAILGALLHGPLAALLAVATALTLASGDSWLTLHDAILLAVGWSAAATAGVVGTRRTGLPASPITVATAPLYWALHSLAAAHALTQLVRSPYRWDKTAHVARAGQARA